jgi:hypothetical protein
MKLRGDLVGRRWKRMVKYNVEMLLNASEGEGSGGYLSLDVMLMFYA